MFDISFIELLVIAIVALVVLGPDKLPDAIRTSALWLGRAKRSFNKAKSEIEQQLNADEIRRQLHNESILSDIEEARRKADALIKDAQQELDSGRDSIKEVVDSAKDIPAITSSAQEGLPTGPAGSDAPPPARDDEPREIQTPRDVGSNERNETNETNESTESTESNESTSDANEPEGAATAAQDTAEQPMHDFYNSPPQGRVRLDGGRYYAVDEPDTTPAKRSSDEH